MERENREFIKEHQSNGELQEQEALKELITNGVKLAFEESCEKVLRLVEEQKKEKEEACHNILQLHKVLYANQKLEMNLENLKWKQNVVKYLLGEDKAAMEKEIKELADELRSQIEDWESEESYN